MVVAFLIIAAVLSLAVMGLVLRPVWSRRADAPGAVQARGSNVPSNTSGDEAARLAVYRDRRLEIDREREDGRLSAEEASRLQAELVSDVAREFGQLEKSTASPANPWAASTLTLLGFVLAAGIYLLVGSPGLIDSAGLRQQMEDARNPEKVIAAMEAKVKAKPDDAESWAVLGSAYKFTGDTPKSLAAFETHFKLAPPKGKEAARPLAEYAEVIAISHGNDFSGKPIELLKQALTLDPEEPKALAMMGAAQFRAGNLKEARLYLGRLIDGMPADSQEVAQLRPLLAKIDERINNGGATSGTTQGATPGTTPGANPAVSPAAPQPGAAQPGAASPASPSTPQAASGPVTVFSGKAVLSAKAREAAAWKDVKVLFVSVRPAAPGAPPMPLAAIRLDKGSAQGDWPVSFSIGDAQAMNQQLSLAQAGAVLIEVHLSRSGQPGKKPGDWFGRLSGLDGAKGKLDNLELQIDQQQP